MSLIQKLVTAIVPRSVAQDMEAESRTWQMRCPRGHEFSVWDAGGIRYKAAGKPTRLMRCPHCGARSWATLYRQGENAPTATDPGDTPGRDINPTRLD